MRVVVFSLVVVAGCVARDDGPTCGYGGYPCARTADCCADVPLSYPPYGYLSCVDGVCVYPTCAVSCVADSDCCEGNECRDGACALACGDPGEACADSAECCSGLRCSDGVCDDCRVGVILDPSGCRDSSVCCAGYTCSRYRTTCQEAKNLEIGQPCTDDAQCLSRFCVGWCTRNCTADSQCIPHGAFCARSAGLGDICYPAACSGAGSTECGVYGYGVVCRPATSVGGVETTICSK